jgi:hypothetical protein
MMKNFKFTKNHQEENKFSRTFSCIIRFCQKLVENVQNLVSGFLVFEVFLAKKLRGVACSTGV